MKEKLKDWMKAVSDRARAKEARTRDAESAAAVDTMLAAMQASMMQDAAVAAARGRESARQDVARLIAGGAQVRDMGI